MVEKPHWEDVGVDLDGVLYCFISALRSYIVGRTGRDESAFPDATTWNFFEDQWGLTIEEFNG